VARTFLDLLNELGVIARQSAQQSAPVQSTPPSPAPKYASRPDLRIRGNPNNPAQQTRQYAAPRPAPVVPNYVRPETPAPPIPAEQAFPAPPPGSNYTPEVWAAFNPEQRGQVWQAYESYRADPEAYEAEQSAQVIPTPADILRAVDESGALQNIPDEIKQRITQPSETIDDLKPAFTTVMDYYEYPLDQRKSITGEYIISEAQGQNPEIDWRAFAAINPHVFGLPSVPWGSMQAPLTDEQKAEVLQIAQLAEQNGEDAGRAVWEWYIGQFSTFQRGLTELGGDPSNWTIGMTPAGNAAMKGGKIAKTVGTILKLPGLVADAPVEVPLGAGRLVRSAIKGPGLIDDTDPIRSSIPVIRTITGSSDSQVARDVAAETAETVATGADIATRYGDEAVVRQDLLEAERIANANQQAERNMRGQGYVPDAPPPPNPNIGPAPLVDQPGTIPPVQADPVIDDIMARVEELQTPAPVTAADEVTEPWTPPEGDYQKAGTVNPSYSQTGAPDPVSAPEDGIYRTGTGGEFERGWAATPPTMDETAEYGRTLLKSRTAAEYPEQSAWVDEQMREWDETFYEPMSNASTSNALSWEQPKSGIHKTLDPMLQGEWYGRRRLLMHAAGMEVDQFPWRRNPLLTGEATDAAFRPGRGNKDLTLQSAIDDFIFSGTPDARKLKQLFDNGVFRKEPGVSAFEQEGYWRYVQSQAIHDLVHATPEQLDTILKSIGVTKAAAPAPADLARLPSVDLLRKSGDEWAAQMQESVAALPREAQVAIYRDLAAFADEINLTDDAPPILRMLRTIEYGAELRKQITRAGGVVPAPKAVFPTNSFDTAGKMRLVIMEPNYPATAQMRRELYDEGMIRKAAPSVSRDVNPALFEDQNIPHQNYNYVHELRAKVHDPLDEVAAEVPTTPTYAKSAKTPNGKVAGPPTKQLSPGGWERMFKAEVKKVLKEWDKNPEMGESTGADMILAKAEANGDLTREQIAALRTVHEFNFGSRKFPVTRKMTVMELILEQDLRQANATMADTRRAVNDIIAKTLSGNAPEMTKRRKVTMGGVRAWDFGTNLTREMHLYGVNVVRGTLGDAVGTGMTMWMTGHPKAAMKAWLSPSAWLSLVKHNLTGADIKSPAVELAQAWGIKPGRNVVDVLARETDQSVGDLAWGKIVGQKAASPLKLGQALRHAGDQQNRLSVWGDEFSKQLHVALNGQTESVVRGRPGVEGFYDRIAAVMGPGLPSESAVADLQRLAGQGGFTPADVRQITKNSELMQEWRETVAAAGKKADAEVDKVLFSYRQTKGDVAVRRVFMYHYWQTRALVQHAKLAATNPLFVYRYHQFWDAMDREAERQGETGALAPMKVWFQFMKGDGGMYGITNPIAWLLPYTMFADAFEDAYPNEPIWETRLRKSGTMIVPQLQGLGVAFGLLQRYPDVVGTSSARTIVRRVLDWDRNNGNHLGLDPGLTGDPVQHYWNRTIERANALIREVFPEVEDVELPNMDAPRQNIVADLIVEQAEAEFGVSFMEMTPAQQEAVTDAIWAARNGETDNDRANAALKEASTLFDVVLDKLIPGGFRMRSEYRDENADLRQEANASDAPNTPAQDNAFEVNEAVSAGSEEAGTLDLERNTLDQLGTDAQRALYEGWNSIAYDTLPGYAVEIIGGETWYGYQVNDLSQEDRMALADAWALENGPAGADTDPGDGIEPKGELELYRDERSEYIAGTDELKGFEEHKDRVKDFDGGAAAFREYAAKESDEFAQAMEQQRTMFEERGYVPSVIERRLDQWAASADGYNALRGVRNKMSDPEPLDTPTELPMSNAETKAMVEEAVADGVGAAGGGGYDQERGMPQWQSDLVDEWQGYRAILDAFEAEYGPVSNFQSDQGQASVARYITENGGVEPSRNLTEYLNWSMDEEAAGRDGSLEAFLAMKNKEYEERKAKEGAASGAG
jgi:hypothetical protein